MKCERLTLVNFCNHAHRVFDFTDGMVAIIGPNGSGKSSIMGAIRFALTGDNPHSGAKTANIRNKAPTTEVSFVELVFSHGAVRATIRRNIRPARPTAVMTFESGEKIEGDTEVTRRITEILGIGTDIVNEIVIVAQKDILGFLDRTPGKRAEQFQRIFRTEHAGVVYKAISDQLKTVEIPAVGVDRDELQRQLLGATSSVNAITAYLQKAPTYASLQQIRDANVNVQSQAVLRANLVTRIQTTTTQRDTVVQSHTIATANLTKANTERETIQQAANGNKGAADAARVSLATLRQTRQVRQQRDQASATVLRLQTSLTQIGPEPTKPVDYIEESVEVQTRFRELGLQLQSTQNFVNSFNGNVVECPMCHTPVSNLDAQLQAARVALPRLQSENTAFNTAMTNTTNYLRAYRDWLGRRDRCAAELKLAEQHLASFQVADEQPVDENALNATLLNEQTYSEGLKEYDQTIQRLTAETSRLEGQRMTLDQQLQQMNDELSRTVLYTEAQIAEANKNVAACDEWVTNRRNNESQLAVDNSKVQSLTEQITAADAVAETARILRLWHAFAAQVRDPFHKDASPRFVAQRNLERLQLLVNESLELFGTSYRVAADEGLSFVATFVDGTVQTADRLSCGQQVVLALAFRIALILVFAENIGALYLDEPTAWLDAEHIRGFEPVLQRLREFSASRGLQCIIITHERDLAPLFDSVVQL